MSTKEQCDKLARTLATQETNNSISNVTKHRQKVHDNSQATLAMWQVSLTLTRQWTSNNGNNVMNHQQQQCNEPTTQQSNMTKQCKWTTEKNNAPKKNNTNEQHENNIKDWHEKILGTGQKILVYGGY